MPARKDAFTLVELMVVIAVIAVLAGVLLPVLMKMTLMSKNTQCLSNLRQIGAAMLNHAGDHDGQMPTSGGTILYHTTDPTTGLPGWTEQLEPYLGPNRQIFVCPSSGPIIPSNAQYSYFQGSHAAYVATGGYAPLRLSLVAAPSMYILGGDIASDAVFPDRGALDADKTDSTKNPAFAPMTKIFHGKRVNLLFADGHVGTFTTFDPTLMNVRYNLRPDGTGYSYSDTD